MTDHPDDVVLIIDPPASVRASAAGARAWIAELEASLAAAPTPAHASAYRLAILEARPWLENPIDDDTTAPGVR